MSGFNPGLFSFQNCLPSLPVPPLEKTLERVRFLEIVFRHIILIYIFVSSFTQWRLIEIKMKQFICTKVICGALCGKLNSEIHVLTLRPASCQRLVSLTQQILISVLYQICPCLSILKGFWGLSSKFWSFSRAECYFTQYTILSSRCCDS